MGCVAVATSRDPSLLREALAEIYIHGRIYRVFSDWSLGDPPEDRGA